MDFKIVEYEGQLVTESRLLAEIIEKRHDHLLRDIRNYIKALDTSPDLGALNYFIEATYPDAKGQMRDCYLVTKLGCSLVAQKMTGTKGILFSAKYAARFEEMEEQLKNQKQNVQIYSYMIEDPVQRAQQWIIEYQERIELQEQLEIVKPKAEYLDTIVQNTDLLTITQIAKDYGMSGVAMNELLHKMKIQFKSGSTWLLYSKYQNNGYTQSSSGINNGQTFTNTKWTQEGKKFIYDILKKEDIYPKIESVEYQLQTI